MNDRKQFPILIAALFESFRQEITEPALLGYEMGLDDLDIPTIKQAVFKAIKQSKFLPSVAELRELAGVPNADAFAIEACDQAIRCVEFTGCYAHIDFEDKAINATIRSLGGWPNFCARFTDAEAEKWARADFIKTYKILDARPIGGEAGKALAGLSEAEPCLNGYRAPTPKRIACSAERRVAIEQRSPTQPKMVEAKRERIALS